jgi:hypothetical protein
MQRKKYGSVVSPGCVGVVDGLLAEVPNLDPSEFIDIGAIQSKFWNRKGYPALNIIANCDAHARYNSVEIRWPGGTNDVIAYNQSDLYHVVHTLLPIDYYLGWDEALKSLKDGKHITPYSGNEIKEAMESGNHVFYLFSIFLFFIYFVYYFYLLFFHRMLLI